MEYLFSYGTLQQEQVQLDTFGRILEGFTDELVGYLPSQVKINDKNVIASSGKEIHPIVIFTGNTEDTVPGTVYKITSGELAQSDKYEVEEYMRVSTTLKSGNTAWVYVAESSHSE